MLNDAKMKRILNQKSFDFLRVLCKLASQDTQMLKNENFSGVNFEECIKAISVLMSKPAE